MIVNGDADHVVDWDALRSAAALAYCPYSGLWVGAAGLCDDGRAVTGCNVENASYGLTLCAECPRGIHPLRELLPDAFEL